MLGLFIANLFIKLFVEMRILPNNLHLCLQTIPLPLTLLVFPAPGALAAPSFETLPLAKRQATCSCRSLIRRVQLTP